MASLESPKACSTWLHLLLASLPSTLRVWRAVRHHCSWQNDGDHSQTTACRDGSIIWSKGAQICERPCSNYGASLMLSDPSTTVSSFPREWIFGLFICIPPFLQGVQGGACSSPSFCLILTATLCGRLVGETVTGQGHPVSFMAVWGPEPLSPRSVCPALKSLYHTQEVSSSEGGVVAFSFFFFPQDILSISQISLLGFPRDWYKWLELRQFRASKYILPWNQPSSVSLSKSCPLKSCQYFLLVH